MTDSKILATTPDLIAVLDIETARPITTEGLRYGARGIVIGIPCATQWRTAKGMETVGPRYKKERTYPNTKASSLHQFD